jgi:hypothetical protein
LLEGSKGGFKKKESEGMMNAPIKTLLNSGEEGRTGTAGDAEGWIDEH